MAIWWTYKETPKQKITCDSCRSELCGSLDQYQIEFLGRKVLLCEQCRLLYNGYRNKRYKAFCDSTLKEFLGKTWDKILGAKDLMSFQEDIKIIEKESGFIYCENHSTCDKCNAICKITDLCHIYSTIKPPYYRICPRCTKLFNDYVLSVPRGYESTAYLDAVKYMFQEGC